MDDGHATVGGAFSVPVSRAGRVDEACDRFEAEFRGGRSPCIEAYLDGVPEADRSALFRELLALDVELRREFGERPTAGDYLGRFQGEASQIRETLGAPVVHEPAPAGRYRKRSFLARGGLGEVFVAYDQELRRDVALKEIQAPYADHAGSRTRFLLEAEVTGGLEHPGIVPVYSLGRHQNGRPYYAMRLVSGNCTLRDAIARYHRELATSPPAERSLALRGLLRRFLDACNAMEYAHSRGVVHRDLKPSNIMLGGYGETLVVDWGLAKRLGGPDAQHRETIPDAQAGNRSDLTQDGAVIGTLRYASPEQASGASNTVGPAGDVYGLGATLYCLLTGRPPHDGRDDQDVHRKALAGDVPAPRRVNPTVPPALEAICLRALALRPEDRYPSCRALADDVERWLADEPVSAYRDPLATRLGRWTRRHRTAVATAAVALLTAAVATSTGAVLIDRQRQAAVAQRSRAERNLVTARATVDEMYTGVAQELAGQWRMDGLRRRLLEKALAFYQDFALPQSAEFAVRLRAASAGLRAGEILAKLGRLPEAEATYARASDITAGLRSEDLNDLDARRVEAGLLQKTGELLHDRGRVEPARDALTRALDAREALAAAHVGHVGIALELAATLMGLGGVDSRGGRADDAERRLGRAIDVLRPLSEAAPGDADVLNALAAAEHSWGTHWVEQINWNRPIPPGRRYEAEAALRHAVDVRTRLVHDHADRADYATGLAISQVVLGNLYQSTDRPQLAIPRYEASVAVQEKLVADHPEQVEEAVRLGATYCNLGVHSMERGEPGPACGWYGRAERVLSGVLAREPANPRARQFLRNAHGARADALGDMHRHAEALAEWDEVMRLDDGRQAEVFRAYRALTRARLGDLDRALAESDAALAAAPDEGEVLAAAGFARAVVASAMAADRARPPHERERLADGHEARSVALIGRAGDAGVFEDPANFSRLTTSKELDRLRQRRDFLDVVRSIEARRDRPRVAADPSGVRR